MLYTNYAFISKERPLTSPNLADEETKHQRTKLAQGEIASEWGPWDSQISNSETSCFWLFYKPTP